VDREVEERFDRIERLLTGVVQVQDAISKNMMSLSGVLELHIRESIERGKQFDERMTRMEQNLDLLIRAITADHSNGKH